METLKESIKLAENENSKTKVRSQVTDSRSNMTVLDRNTLICIDIMVL